MSHTINLAKPSVATLKARANLARKKTVLLSTILRNIANGTYILAEQFNKDDLVVLLQCHVIGQAKLLGCLDEFILHSLPDSLIYNWVDEALMRVVKQLKYWAYYSGNYNHPIPASLTAYATGNPESAGTTYQFYTLSNLNLYDATLNYGRARLAACAYLSRRLEYKKEYDLKIPTKLVLHLFNVISPLDIVSK